MMKKAIKEIRANETYSIKVIVEKRDELTRFPNITPRATDITSLDVLRDLRLLFDQMAMKFGGRVEITRTLHFWCCRCHAYLGSRDILFCEERYCISHGLMESSLTTDLFSFTHECVACGEMTAVQYYPVLYTM
jgi:hypothetical protein